MSATDAFSWPVAIGTFILGSGQFLTWLSGRHRGNKGKTESAKAFERLEGKVAGVETQVAALSAHVIGPDGENGIRGDVRELKKHVEGILERERNGLWNPQPQPYDRRRQ